MLTVRVRLNHISIIEEALGVLIRQLVGGFSQTRITPRAFCVIEDSRP